MKQPEINIGDKRFPVKMISWEHETGEMVYVTYLDKSEPLPQDQEKVAWKQDHDLAGAVRWPKHSRILRGDNMLADKDYPRRLREFEDVINPKPPGTREAYEAKNGKTYKGGGQV